MTGSHNFNDGNGPVVAHQHENGGGWVADSATVDATAHVGRDARVYGNAQVYGDARVYGNARVYGDAQVYGYAQVYDDAQVYGNAQVWGNARVWGDARVYGDAQVHGYAQVWGDAQVYGDARVRGDARVCQNELAPRLSLDVVTITASRRDWVELMMIADVHADDCDTRVRSFAKTIAPFYEKRRDKAREWSDRINVGLSPRGSR